MDTPAGVGGVACGGAGGLGEILPLGTRMEQCLKGGPCGMKVCWSSARRVAACEKPTWHHFWSDSIPGERYTWTRNRE